MSEEILGQAITPLLNIIGLPSVGLILAFFIKKWFRDLDHKMCHNTVEISKIKDNMNAAINEIKIQMVTYEVRAGETAKAAAEYRASLEEFIVMKSQVQAAFRHIDVINRGLQKIEDEISSYRLKADNELMFINQRISEIKMKCEIQHQQRSA